MHHDIEDYGFIIFEFRSNLKENKKKKRGFPLGKWISGAI